jgi:zinc protease
MRSTRVAKSRRILIVAGLILVLGAVVRLARYQFRTETAVTAGSRQIPAQTDPLDIPAWQNRFARQLAPPTELRPDPETTSGRLSNGVRYFLLERPDEFSQVSFRLLVLAGSMHEDENERGLAHFVEHMAFRKSRHAPQGLILETMERLGLKAGADTNAYTSTDHTVYKLNLPDAEEIPLESALTFLRDVADGLLFDPDEVEMERKIVLREMDERSHKAERIRVLPAIFPDVPAARRPPIGQQTVIEQVTAAQLRGFWQRHYVPERMVLVVAGDFRRTEMKERVSKHFAGLTPRPAPADPPRGNPLTDEGLTVECVPLPGETTVSLRIAVPQPEEKEADHAGLRERQLAVDLGLRMLNNRLDRRATAAKLPIAAYRIQDHRLNEGIHWFEILCSATKPEAVPDLMRHTISAWRAARATGFDDWEFAEARQEMKSSFLRRYVSRLSQPCAAAADVLVASVLKRCICESPEDELNRARTILYALTRRECERLTESAWKQSVTRVIVSGAIESGSEAWLESLVQAAWKIPAILPRAVPPPRPLPIAPSGAPGRLEENHLRMDPDYQEARFSNGVAVRLKPIAGLGGAVIGVNGVRVKVIAWHNVSSG